MSSLKTKLSVPQIQLALRNSFLFDQRSSVVVPNISWGMLPYEADLIDKISGKGPDFEKIFNSK